MFFCFGILVPYIITFTIFMEQRIIDKVRVSKKSWDKIKLNPKIIRSISVKDVTK